MKKPTRREGIVDEVEDHELRVRHLQEMVEKKMNVKETKWDQGRRIRGDSGIWAED